jgi:hypothetical protein
MMLTTALRRFGVSCSPVIIETSSLQVARPNIRPYPTHTLVPLRGMTQRLFSSLDCEFAGANWQEAYTSVCTVTSYILYNLGPLPPRSFKILINVINTLLALSQEKREGIEQKKKGHYRKSSFSNNAARDSFPPVFISSY